MSAFASQNEPIVAVPASVWAVRRTESSTSRAATAATQRMPCSLVEVRRFVPDPAAGFSGRQSAPLPSPAQLLLQQQQQQQQQQVQPHNSSTDLPTSCLARESSSPFTISAPFLVGFVTWQGANEDRRHNVWLPLTDIFLSHDATAPIALAKNSSALINEQLRALIPVDDRKRLFSQSVVNSELPFLEERLRRDCAVPPLVRSVHYLDHTMPAWYFSPLNVKFAEFSVSKASHAASRTTSSAAASNAAAAATASGNKSNTSSAGMPAVRNSFEEIYDAHVCPFSLRMFRSRNELMRCWMQQALEDRAPPHPPGESVYRDDAGGITIYRVCGKSQHNFCTNLLLLARCFLENKLCGHEPSLYTFFVMALDHEQVFQSSNNNVTLEQQPQQQSQRRPERYFAGYYSVERGETTHNLACIVVLPCFQSRGLGRLLIALSYKVALAGINSKPAQGEVADLVTTAAAVKERRRKTQQLFSSTSSSSGRGAAGRTKRSRAGLPLAVPRYNPGTPERPLSDLGHAMYSRFWDGAVWSWVARECAVMARAGAISVSSSPQQQVNNTNNNNGGDSSVVKRRGSNNNNNGSEEEKGSGAAAASGRQVTLEELAAEVELAADDLRETILRLGLVHRTETKSLKLLLPQSYAQSIQMKIDRMPNQLRAENLWFQ